MDFVATYIAIDAWLICVLAMRTRSHTFCIYAALKDFKAPRAQPGMFSLETHESFHIS
jgi:hypothetical protein